MAWDNFNIWRGRLPHWRADNVCYYVTFRHRRRFEVDECSEMLNALLKPHGSKWSIVIVCVLPEASELMCAVHDSPLGMPYELSDILEGAKSRAAKKIIKATGERFPPIYAESYDRIVRDPIELEERWQKILASPVEHELVDEPEEYPFLWVADSPN